MNKRNLPSWEELKQYKIVKKRTIGGIEREVVSKATLSRIVVKMSSVEQMESLPVMWKEYVTEGQYTEYYQHYLSRHKSHNRPIHEERVFSLIIDEGLSDYAKTCLYDEGEDEDN